MKFFKTILSLLSCLVLLSSCAHVLNLKSEEDESQSPKVTEQRESKKSPLGFALINESLYDQWITHSSGTVKEFKGEGVGTTAFEGTIGSREQNAFFVIGVSHHYFTDKSRQLNFSGENLYAGVKYKAAKFGEKFYLYPALKLVSGRYEVEDRYSFAKDTYAFTAIDGSLGLVWFVKPNIYITPEYFYMWGSNYKSYGARVGFGMGL